MLAAVNGSGRSETTHGQRAAAPLPFEWFGFDPDAIAERSESIPTDGEPGPQPDGLDELELFDDPLSGLDLLPLDLILGDADRDPAIAKVVEIFHLEGTPEERFEAYFQSGTAQALGELMARFDVLVRGHGVVRRHAGRVPRGNDVTPDANALSALRAIRTDLGSSRGRRCSSSDERRSKLGCPYVVTPETARCSCRVTT